jgi:hypothetical protein
VQFGPCFHEPPLAARKIAGNQLYRLETIDRNFRLVLGMKVRGMVRCCDLGIHPNDDAEKAGKFRHSEPISFTHMRQYWLL